jgi:glycosyltransferase involved in cell wall biosynthesis
MNPAATEPGSLTFLVDLRVAQYNGDRGIPAYSQSLIRQICLDHPHNRYLFLWDDRLPRPSFAGEFEQYGTWVVESPVARGHHGRIDVLFTTCFFLPLHGRGEEYLYPRWLQAHQPHRLGIVYDLIPYLFPERYLTRRDALNNYLAGFRVMRDSDRLFAISQATRHDTIRFAGFDPGRIRCVYGDIDHRKRSLIASPPADEAAVLARHGLRPPYAVYIGGDDWRKNMDGMVNAFAHFHARHPDRQLAVICKLSRQRIAHYQLMAASLGIRDGALVFTGYVPDEDLVAITRQAEQMTYPSLYEGLGLPVLEAYGCGIPVVGSNCSSIKELVIPELTCDPREPLAIALAMGRLIEEPRLREASLARGRELLAILGWEPAARAVMDELTGRPPASDGQAVAVVGVLPPTRTAIAACTLDTLQSARWRTDFFDANQGPALAPGRALLPGNRILPVEVLPPMLAAGDHGTVVFVLGNSEHHVKVLRAAMQTRLGCRQRRLAYLHDANLKTLLRAALGADAHDLPRGGCHSQEPWVRQTLESVPEIGQSLRFLADSARFDGLIVNSDACRRLVLAALGPVAAGWTIDVAFLPIVTDLAGHRDERAADGLLHVGTFGTGGDAKQLDLLAAAVELISRRRPVRLTLAGWSMERVCRRLGISAHHFARVYDSPEDEQLEALMREVAVAVQLRSPSHGESSAAVSRLIGLGTPVVVTGEGSFAELPSTLATPVPASCSSADLAAAIEWAATHRVSAAEIAATTAAFSPAALAARLSDVFAGTASLPALRRPA